MNGPHEQPSDLPSPAPSADDIRALAGDDEREAAALVESWTALGQLLEASAPRLDEASLARAVELRMASRSARTTNVSQPVDKSRRALRYLAGAAIGLALAAALLLAVSVPWQPVPVEPQGDLPQIANVVPAAVDLAVTPSSGLELAWDDDFSAQLESAQASVRSIEGSWREGLDTATIVRQRIDEYARELEAAPL